MNGRYLFATCSIIHLIDESRIHLDYDIVFRIDIIRCFDTCNGIDFSKWYGHRMLEITFGFGSDDIYDMSSVTFSTRRFYSMTIIIYVFNRVRFGFLHDIIHP